MNNPMNIGSTEMLEAREASKKRKESLDMTKQDQD